MSSRFVAFVSVAEHVLREVVIECISVCHAHILSDEYPSRNNDLLELRHTEYVYEKPITPLSYSFIHVRNFILSWLSFDHEISLMTSCDYGVSFVHDDNGFIHVGKNTAWERWILYSIQLIWLILLDCHKSNISFLIWSYVVFHRYLSVPFVWDNSGRNFFWSETRNWGWSIKSTICWRDKSPDG